MNDAFLPLAPTPPPSIDWNAMAESFDRWLPHIRPVGDRLIELAAAFREYWLVHNEPPPAPSQS